MCWAHTATSVLDHQQSAVLSMTLYLCLIILFQASLLLAFFARCCCLYPLFHVAAWDSLGPAFLPQSWNTRSVGTGVYDPPFSGGQAIIDIYGLGWISVMVALFSL